MIDTDHPAFEAVDGLAEEPRMKQQIAVSLHDEFTNEFWKRYTPEERQRLERLAADGGREAVAEYLTPRINQSSLIPKENAEPDSPTILVIADAVYRQLSNGQETVASMG